MGFRICLMLLLALLALSLIFPARVLAQDLNEAGCYPDRTTTRSPTRRQGVKGFYRAARQWLRHVLGSLTAPKRSDLEQPRAPRQRIVIPSFRLDWRRERLLVGLRMRF